MFLKSFFIENRFLQLIYQNGKNQTIVLDQNSGKIIWCLKDRLGNRHTGILVGIDVNTGELQVIHNHSKPGKPEIINITEFSGGETWHFEKDRCENGPIQIIKNGLEAVLEGRAYNIFFYNCQTLTNQASKNVKRSPDVERGFLMALGLFVGGLFIAAATEE